MADSCPDSLRLVELTCDFAPELDLEPAAFDALHGLLVFDDEADAALAAFDPADPGTHDHPGFDWARRWYWARDLARSPRAEAALVYVVLTAPEGGGAMEAALVGLAEIDSAHLVDAARHVVHRGGWFTVQEPGCLSTTTTSPSEIVHEARRTDLESLIDLYSDFAGESSEG